MQASEVADRVRATFGDKDGAQLTDDDLLRWINDAQFEIAVKFEFSQVKGVHDLLAGEPEYGLPDGVFKIYSVVVTGIPLIYVKPQVGMELPNMTGGPANYWVWDKILHLSPTPAQSKLGGLVVYYLAKPDSVVSLDNELTVPEEYHTRVVEYCLAQAYLLDNSLEAYGAIMSKLNSDIPWFFNDKTTDRTNYYPVIGAGDEYE